MFTREELTVLVQSLSALDIKGSDAIYIATLMSKINQNINEIDEAAEAKEKAKQELLSQEVETKSKKNK